VDALRFDFKQVFNRFFFRDFIGRGNFRARVFVRFRVLVA
jgi:hypothetical protein